MKKSIGAAKVKFCLLKFSLLMLTMNADAQESNHEEAELSPSFWASNCKATLTNSINDLQNNLKRTRPADYERLPSATKAQLLLIDTYKNAAYNFSKKFPPDAKFPDYVEEADGNNKQLVKAYNSFASESKRFMGSLKPGSPSFGKLTKCHHAPHQLGTDQGAFAKQIETTKRFIMFRLFFAQMAAKEVNVKRGDNPKASELQSAISSLFNEKIETAQNEMKSCTQNVWNKSQQHFLHRPQAASAAKGCTKDDLAEFNKLFTNDFQKVAGTMSSSNSSSSVAELQPSPDTPANR